MAPGDAPSVRPAATARRQISPCNLVERSEDRHRRSDILRTSEHLVSLDPRIHVATEQVAHRRLCAVRQQVDAQVGSADVVGFLHDQTAAFVEARGRTREGEGDEQAQQRKYGTVDGAGAGQRTIGIGDPSAVRFVSDIEGSSSMPANKASETSEVSQV